MKTLPESGESFLIEEKEYLFDWYKGYRGLEFLSGAAKNFGAMGDLAQAEFSDGERRTMTDQQVLPCDERYKSIWHNENRTGQIIAARVVEKPEFSAWMILIPIVIVPYMQRYQKYKESVKTFCEGYLFSKIIALDAAYQADRDEVPWRDNLPAVKKTVRKNPDADPRVLQVYQKQIQEIELLCDHYAALLAAGKVDYGEMITVSYQTRDNYLSFIAKLAEAEKEVTAAVLDTFKDDAAEIPEIMAKMERHLLEYRLEEAEKLFL